jgi:hypothetical protein
MRDLLGALDRAGGVEAARARDAHQDVDRLEAEPGREQGGAPVAHLVVVSRLGVGRPAWRARRPATLQQQTLDSSVGGTSTRWNGS